MVVPVPNSICSDFASKISLNVAKNCTFILIALHAREPCVSCGSIAALLWVPEHLSIQKKGNTGKMRTSSP